MAEFTTKESIEYQLIASQADTRHLFAERYCKTFTQRMTLILI